MAKSFNAVSLLLDGARGIYIPRDFVEDFDLADWHISPESWEAQACADPESEGYWDAWNQILDRAYYIDADGNRFDLYQDGDLWALCYDKMTAEEHQNFDIEID